MKLQYFDIQIEYYIDLCHGFEFFKYVEFIIISVISVHYFSLNPLRQDCYFFCLFLNYTYHNNCATYSSKYFYFYGSMISTACLRVRIVIDLNVNGYCFLKFVSVTCDMCPFLHSIFRI